MPEPVFVLPTDGVTMMSVKSTAQGRIFLGGKDGCLYEITYQVKWTLNKILHFLLFIMIFFLLVY